MQWSLRDTDYQFNYSVTSPCDYFAIKTITKGEEREREGEKAYTDCIYIAVANQIYDWMQGDCNKGGPVVCANLTHINHSGIRNEIVLSLSLSSFFKKKQRRQVKIE